MCCVSVWLSLVSVWALLSWGYVWRFVLKPIHYVFLYGRIFFFFFFPRLRVEENNTFTVVFPNPQHIHFHLLFHAVDLKLFTAFFFFSVLSLSFPVVVCFPFLLLDLLLEHSKKSLPHHVNSRLSGWLHHVTKCFMSHWDLTLSILLSTAASQHSVMCSSTFKKNNNKKRLNLKKKQPAVQRLKIVLALLENKQYIFSDKWLHRRATLWCCCEQMCVCAMPRAERCQTRLRRWYADLFGETPDCLSLAVSLRAISQPFVERLEAVISTSDSSTEDIVFAVKIVVMPAVGSDNVALILFQCKTFKYFFRAFSTPLTIPGG